MSASARPRVLLVCPSGEIGGMERVVVRLARGLGMRGWDASVAFAPDRSRGALLRWATLQGVPAAAHYPAVRIVDEKHDTRAMGELVALVRQHRPDVVNLHYPGAHISMKDVLAVRFGARVPCAINVHLPVPWAEAGRRKRILTRVAGAFVDRVVVHSDSLKGVLEEAGIRRSKIAVIPNGAVAAMPTLGRCHAREALGIPHDAFVAGCFARLAPIKRQAVLIEAARQMCESGSDVFLLFGGDGPDRDDLERLAAATIPGRYRFLGQVEDSPDQFFAATDILALSSEREGMPMVIVEAAVRGVPAVVTDVGGVRELIAEGETGLLVPPETPTALAAALLRIERDRALLARLGAAAKRRAGAEFSEELMTERYDRVFRECLKR